MPLPRYICFLHVITLVASTYAPLGDCDEHDSGLLLLVAGEPVSATVEELKPDWSVSVKVDADPRELERSEYVLWGTYSDVERSPQVLLTDGTVLVADIVRIDDKSVTVASRLWGELQLDRRLVRACSLSPPVDPLIRDREWQLLQAPEPADRVLLLNRDAIVGKLVPTTERDGEGIFGLVSLGIALSAATPPTRVLIGEVSAITFAAVPEPESQSPPECLLGFRDGSLVAASKLTRAEPDMARLTSVAGASLQLQIAALRKNLTFIQPRNETVNYLSDLPAVGYKFLPLLELEWPLGISTNTLGGRLRSQGDVIPKGIGMHSTSRVAYNLDRKYRRFQAEVAIDDHAEHQGSVVYRVLLEVDSDAGEPKWNLAFTSPIIRGGDPPLPIDIDVTSATRLALVVEMADRVDTRDYANWLNARLLLCDN